MFPWRLHAGHKALIVLCPQQYDPNAPPVRWARRGPSDWRGPKGGPRGEEIHARRGARAPAAADAGSVRRRGRRRCRSRQPGERTDATTAPVARQRTRPPTRWHRRRPSRRRRPPARSPATTDVQPAVIQIVAHGTFRDPEIGSPTAPGSGSGFIISPDGLAVTNNHVVTGAATLEVFVGGDTDDELQRHVLGVSECNDLALIDIDGDDDLPYLDWYDGDINAGPRRLRRRLPARRSRVHPHQRHRRQGQGRRRPHRARRRSTTRSSTTPTSSPATPAARWSTTTARSSA